MTIIPSPLHRLLQFLLATLLLATPPLLAQTTYTWTGNALNGDFASADNWLGGNVPPQLTSGSLNLVFGESESGITQLINHRTPMRVNQLLFRKDADAYEIIDGDWRLEQLYNLSQYEQVLQALSITLYTHGNGGFVNTGKAGIRLEGEITIQGSSQHGRTISKRGLGTLTLAGDISGDFIWSIAKGTLELDVSNGYQYNPTTDSIITLRGGQLRIIGNDTGATTLNLYEFGDASYPAVGSTESSRITVDGNGGTGTLVTFSQWQGYGSRPGRQYDAPNLIATTATLNFNLVQNAGVHFQTLQSGLLGVDNVIYWSTTTDSNGNNRLSGFTQLASNVDDGGYDVTRYAGYTALPANQSGISGGHYYINGNHTITGTAVTAGVNAARTLTLQGTGTFYITGVGLQLGNLLLQEGNGNYTIDIENSPTTRYLIASSLGTAAQQQQRDNTLTLHQYRETGDLIIQGGGIGGNRLVTSGPGTIRLKTSAFSANLTRVFIQEGKLQFEGTGADILTQIDAYGTVAGSSQIGSSAALVRVYEGGTVDATPTVHITESGVRGLQIYGKLQLDNVSTFAMNLTSDVIANNYNPLRVIKEVDSVTPTVTLATATDTTYGVDLQLALTGHLTSVTWITLLETDGTISGAFATVNGQAFGENHHFVLSHLGVDYDAYLHYDYDLGGGMTGIVLHAIPEPPTIALLAGLTLVAVAWVRRDRKGSNAESRISTTTH